MNDMTLFLDLILIASGAYCMYTFLRLAVTKRLFKNGLLVPKEKKISDCADEQMYIGYMMPPLAVMAVMTMGYGVCMLLNDLRETPFPVAAGDPGRRAGLARLVRHPQFPCQPGVFRYVNENDSAASCRNSRRRLFAYLEVRAAGPCWSFSRA